ncbi:MAG: ABC transporter substrate-binding protein [Mariprofundaceae bacterium]|nr:ABC transporter substrate-binding protein [Mariprofundaceae bacterium]
MSLLSAGLLLMLAACTPAPPAEIRLATNVWPGYEPLYLARSLGLFNKTGIRLIEYPSATGTMRALKDGSIEAGALTLDEVLSLLDNKVDLSVILLLDESHGADAVVARPDINGLGGLRGSRIAAESSALGGYVLGRLLDKAGLALHEIRFVPLELNAMESAFAADKVDAVVCFEPVKSRLLAMGGKVVFDSSQLPGEIVDVLAVRSEALRRHPKSFKLLAEKWFLALAYLKANPEDAARRMQPRLRIAQNQVLSQFRGLRLGDRQHNHVFFDNPEHPPVKIATQLLKAMQEQGLTQHKPELQQLFRPTTEFSSPDKAAP